MAHLARLTLAVNPDGNWSLTPDDVPNDFPPIALPARDFPVDGSGPADAAANVAVVQAYAVAMLRAGRVPVPDEGLRWQYVGHTVVDGKIHGAFRATWEVLT